MVDRKPGADWRHKQVNESEKKYSKAEILENFKECELPAGVLPPSLILSEECQKPLGGVREAVAVVSARKYSGGKEKIPSWYLDDKGDDEDFKDVEEKFSRVDVLYEEKIKSSVEEDEKIPEWEDLNTVPEEVENEVIVYPAGLIKMHAEEGNPFAAIILTHSTQNHENLITNPSSIPFEKVWFYKDPQSVTQGPFSTIDMFNWSAAGYFTNNLQIAHLTPCHFFALQMYVIQEKYKLLSNSIG